MHTNISRIPNRLRKVVNTYHAVYRFSTRGVTPNKLNGDNFQDSALARMVTQGRLVSEKEPVFYQELAKGERARDPTLDYIEGIRGFFVLKNGERNRGVITVFHHNDIYRGRRVIVKSLAPIEELAAIYPTPMFWK